MKKKLAVIAIALCSAGLICLYGSGCTNFFSPTVTVIKNRPPNPPVIDSIVPGVSNIGKEGLWIFFHPFPADSTEDLESFILLRKASEDSSDEYKLLYQKIPVDLRKVFDSRIVFPKKDDASTYVYSYRMIARDSALPQNNSDTCSAESLAVCKQAELIFPVKESSVNAVEKFKCRVWDMAMGFKLFIGVGQAGKTYWYQQICDPKCYVFASNWVYMNSSISYNQNGKAKNPVLLPGTYYWWIRIVWDGSTPSSESVSAGEFTVKK